MAWRFDIIACIMLCMRASYALYACIVCFVCKLCFVCRNCGKKRYFVDLLHNMQKSDCTSLFKVCLFDSSLVLNVCRTSFRRKVTFVRTRRWDSNPRMNSLQINFSTREIAFSKGLVLIGRKINSGFQGLFVRNPQKFEIEMSWEIIIWREVGKVEEDFSSGKVFQMECNKFLHVWINNLLLLLLILWLLYVIILAVHY